MVMLKRIFALQITCFLIFCSSAYAQLTSDRVLDSESALAWADESVGSIVADGRATGAVVSIVKDGEVILAKGYGQGDVVAHTPASPDKTRVRIGSTTKTFTATIIAQLMEEGLIASLDDSANTYLERYQLPANDGVDISLRHLLTHTAGFEDKFYFIGSDKPVEIPVEGKTFDRLRPPFVRPVDEMVVYSNFGVATLGLVIEDLTGLPIDEVMQRRIFGPLSMDDTDLLVTINEPLDLAKPGNIAPDYRVSGPTRFTAINPAVAQTGAIVSTASDMAKYMNAQLGHGDFLSPRTQAKLHTRLVDNAPEIGGVGMVFFIDEWAGHKTVSHGGNWAGFHTWMTLLPDDGIGVYVTLLGDAPTPGLVERFANAVAPNRAHAQSPAMLSASSVPNAFLADQYGPKRSTPIIDAAALQGLKQYAGFYRGDRRPFSFAEELSSLVYFGAGVLKVDAGSDGLYLGAAGPWVPVGDDRFMLDAGPRPIMVIELNPRTGKLTLLPEIGIYTFTKIPWWASPKLHAIIIHILLPLTLIGLFAPFIIGRTRLALASFTIGLAGLAMVSAAAIMFTPERSLMDGYYVGRLLRLSIFVLAANVMAAAVVAACLQMLKSARYRWRIAALTTPAFVVSVILSQYGALGVKLI